jgi:endonuclease V-like protein UPF0215 family
VPPAAHPHVLGIDDAPFTKGRNPTVPIVGVMMEGARVVEAVAITSFAVDGEDPTAFVAEWIGGLRVFASLQAVVLGGITIAGLGVIDLRGLAARLSCPVLAVTRRDPAISELRRALAAAHLEARLPIVERCPPAQPVAEGLFVSAAGIPPADAATLVRKTLGKSRLPEPLRVAHLVARALVMGESRGRV